VIFSFAVTVFVCDEDLKIWQQQALAMPVVLI
jgi:hypothetical protein